jgi:L-ascorbate 6-phosphate lactonase
MAKIDSITRESWILSTFPEWGTWLNEEIAREVVAPGSFAMWWLGCTGIWLKSAGGNLYHSGDSHYSNYYAKHGNDHKIDVALGSFGENPRGVTDKMTSIDILRMAECLNTKVVIPFHHDIWTNFQADPSEVIALWNLRKDRLQYKFKPFSWQVGGKFVYPADKDKLEYHHPRGFDDAFSGETDLPYPSFL